MKETKINKFVRNNKSLIIVSVITLMFLSSVVYATVISDTADSYFSADNVTVNDTGFYSGDEKLTKTVDVVVCRGTNTDEDENLKKICDIVCLSTDDDCDSEFDDAVSGGNKRVMIMQGRYPMVSVVLESNTTLFGAGIGKSSDNLVTLVGDGSNPIINLVLQNATENANLTKSINIQNIYFLGNDSETAINFTNVDILRFKDNVVRNSSTCLNFDYVGTEPPTSSTVPGGFWIEDSAIICGDTAINLNKQTQGWVSNNWFPSGSASSIAHIIINQTNKVRFIGNEFNAVDTGGCGILFVDTGDRSTQEIVMVGNWHGETPGLAFNFSGLTNTTDSNSILINDLATSSSQTTDYPISTIQEVSIDIFPLDSYVTDKVYNNNVKLLDDRSIVFANAGEEINSHTTGSLNYSVRTKHIFNADTNDNDSPTEQSFIFATNFTNKFVIQNNGNVSVLSGKSVCFDGTTCNIGLYYNGSCIVAVGADQTGNCL